MQKALLYQRAIGAVRHRLLTHFTTRFLASLFLVFGVATSTWATGFYKDFVVANGTYYYTNANVGGLPQFQGSYLGSYDRGTGVLPLGAEANTFSDNGDDVQAPQLFYRVYLQNTTPPGAFTPLNTSFVQAGLDGKPTNQKWNNVTTNPNLIQATNGPGTYVLEVFFQGQATYNNSGGSGTFNFYDNANANNYKATFEVTGSVPVQWTGNAGDSPNSWFVADNWSPNVVPTTTTDVTIPYLQNGNNPKISSGTATVRTLIVNGSTANPGARSMFQTGGELQVYGNFLDGNNSFSQTGGTFNLAGNVPQTFDGGSFFDFRVAGTQRKTLNTRMDILNTLTFGPGSGIIVTRTDNTSLYNIDLGPLAQISGETESSYVLGVLRSPSRTVNPGANDFGNIGVVLTVTVGNPGKTLVTRVTGPDNFAYYGVGTSKSIRRGFIFLPDSPNNLEFSILFRYLDSELNNIPEANLVMFRSPNGAIPFQYLSKTAANPGDNTVLKAGITGTLSATFTLGDRENPLPVNLVSFTATATPQGTASLRWRTASELNNKGFGIERQLEGSTAWEPLGYVAGSNLAAGSSYSYTDRTLAAVAAPKVYYRLRQEDTDGKLHYSPVAALTTAAASGELTLSPVPVRDAQPLSINFAEASQAGVELVITNMQGQRVLRYTTSANADAAVQLPVSQLAAGVYVLSVQVPGQAVRHARFVKQ